MRGLKDEWLLAVIECLEKIGLGHLSKIYKEAGGIRLLRRGNLPPSSESIIQRTLENFSSDSENYLGNYDLFRMVHGKGHGWWTLYSPGLRQYKSDRQRLGL